MVSQYEENIAIISPFKTNQYKNHKGKMMK
jgi:hypothetical protein